MLVHRLISIHLCAVNLYYIAAPDDYNVTNSVTVNPMESQVCVSVTAVQDNVDEPDEDFRYTITMGMGDYQIGMNSTMIITITGKPIFWNYLSIIFHSSSSLSL